MPQHRPEATPTPRCALLFIRFMSRSRSNSVKFGRGTCHKNRSHKTAIAHNRNGENGSRVANNAVCSRCLLIIRRTFLHHQVGCRCFCHCFLALHLTFPTESHLFSSNDVVVKGIRLRTCTSWSSREWCGHKFRKNMFSTCILSNSLTDCAQSSTRNSSSTCVHESSRIFPIPKGEAPTDARFCCLDLQRAKDL